MPRWLSLVFEKLIQLLSKESSVIGSKTSNPSSPDVAKWRGLPVRGVAFVGRTWDRFEEKMVQGGQTGVRKDV